MCDITIVSSLILTGKGWSLGAGLGACQGGDSCCGSDGYKCGVGEGDCDSDGDCAEGLRCGKDNCPKKDPFDWNDDSVGFDDCCESTTGGTTFLQSYLE